MTVELDHLDVPLLRHAINNHQSASGLAANLTTQSSAHDLDQTDLDNL